MTATDTKTDLVSRKPDALERTFELGRVEGLSTSLGDAMLELSKLASKMSPDDISLTLDLPAGVLQFRAYRRDRR